MHGKSVLVALAAPALISAAAIPQNDPDNWDNNSDNIVGGVAASAGDFPFIVSLQTAAGSHFCGGTLVNGNTVVTAAHCAVGQTASNLQIRAGTLNRASGGVTARVSSIRIHPSYSASTYNNDVAILKLSSNVAQSSTISYASLASSGSDPAAGSAAVVAGWGTTTQGGQSLPTALRKVDVPIISRTTCRSNYGSSAITNQMFCAGYAAGGKDSCQGDSGGPIVNSAKTLIGIVSWGNGCAQPNAPGVYASVGALSSFITSNLS